MVKAGSSRAIRPVVGTGSGTWDGVYRGIEEYDFSSFGINIC